MKPLNLDNSPCSPTSSNCVIWQGPDLACIKLCKGDTVSDVVAKLAAELCTILDQLNVNNYDLTCFNSSACPPVDFQALIQFLINHICALEGVTPNTNPSTSTCPDCVVSIAPCFIIGTQTTMQLTDYVQMIGERVCDLITTIDGLQTQINNIDARVTVLENAPKETFTLPSITVACTLSPTVLEDIAYPIDTVLNALVNDPTNGYCSLIDATGLGAELFSAVSSQCITSTTPTLSNYPVPFGTEYLGTWVATPTTVADAITNLWIVVCDMYEALDNLNTITVEDTNTVSLTLSPSNVLTALVQDTGWHPLNGFDWYGPNIISQRPRARRIGNVIYFKGTVMVPLANPISDAPIVWDYQQPSINTYAPLTSIKPAETGAGSVIINSGGSITFNQGNSVIPAAVLPLSINLDDSYSFNWEIGWRNIQMVSATASITTSMLTTLFRPIITIDKKLSFQLVEDIEQSASSITGNVYGTSLANNLISNVQVGEYVPFYRSASSVMNSSPLANLQSVELRYGSETALSDVYTFPFTCQASDKEQVGGFGWIKLDPYSTYISPCADPIPTPTPCAIP